MKKTLLVLSFIVIFQVSVAPAYAAGVGASCTAKPDCDSGLACINSTCHETTGNEGDVCGITADCKSGLTCSANICEASSATRVPGAVTGAGATPPGTVTGGAAGNTSTGLQNPLNNIKTLPDLLDAIIGGIIEIGSIFLVLMLVYVGFLFVKARGNEEQIREARSALVWTVIGGLILLGAAAIKAVILATANTL